MLHEWFVSAVCVGKHMSGKTLKSEQEEWTFGLLYNSWHLLNYENDDEMIPLYVAFHSAKCLHFDSPPTCLDCFAKSF